jgi:hypothetical protein
VIQALKALELFGVVLSYCVDLGWRGLAGQLFSPVEGGEERQNLKIDFRGKSPYSSVGCSANDWEIIL